MSGLLEDVLALEGVCVDESIPFSRMKESLAIKADNVCRYYWTMGRKEELKVPCVMPPSPATWIEYEMTPETAPGAQGRAGMGCLILSVQVTDERVGQLEGTVSACEKALLIEAKKQGARAVCGARWFRRFEGRLGEAGSTTWAVMPEGGLMCYPTSETLEGRAMSVVRPPRGIEWDDMSYQVLGGSLNVVLLTLSFMHCRNVETVTGRILKVKRKGKRERIPTLRYRTLDIGPMTKVLATEGRVSEKGLSKALHICRGHFKDFSEKGLFGRENMRGRYWWPMHVRGELQQGIVAKDYDVNPEGGNDGREDGDVRGLPEADPPEVPGGAGAGPSND